ncbi:helix-turn-helix domain-containing protein [Flavobacterium sp. Sd200]|uniref:helix-turn-helix domain-containing protein n=1 Tax=Flavobacterium sp. Sd200 TaxID=2692211 RepID=UPI001369FFE5|nr:XRE family transcriptional regulator [Flavobacterium sp. Sd200]MXN90454.1 helix-turn-helix domain-containing protein [Flavobacterium sp. Sd200]
MSVLDNNTIPNDNEINNLGVGERIRILRTAQNRTLQEVADSCGLSKSMISKVENNKAVPSVAALVKIAQTLGTNISQLLEQDGWDKAIVTTRKEAENKLVKTEKGYMIFPYASEFHEKKMQPFLFVARKGEVIPHQLSHEGEEFVYVIEGSMKMQVAETEYILKTGDSLYFNAMQKHGILPISESVTYLDIFV